MAGQDDIPLDPRVEPDSKSCPRYPPPAADPEGRFHLLVAQVGAGAALSPVREQVRAGGFRHYCLLAGGPWDENLKGDEYLADDERLPDRLECLLENAGMGTRLYIGGDEPFLWRVYRVAVRSGMHPDAIRLSRAGPPSRPVFCVHCRGITRGASCTLVNCSGCGRTLFVRDHFSRDLGAYAGVQADAEVAGDLPSPALLRR